VPSSVLTRTLHGGEALPREGQAAESAGIPEGIFLQSGSADGERERLPRPVGRAACPPRTSFLLTLEPELLPATLTFYLHRVYD
jgi:hypothetical protein